jgi:hypothetical protein
VLSSGFANSTASTRTDFSVGPVEPGISFKAGISGIITATRIYKSAASTGLHVGYLLLLNADRLGHTTAGKMKSYFINPQEKPAAFQLSVRSEKS